MEQTKLESSLESFVNQLSGIALAFIVWRYVIIPVYNIPDPGFGHNITITLTFTVVSMIRGYVWRRFFNRGLHKFVHRFVMKYYTMVKETIK